MKKVSTIEASIATLNSKIYENVSGLDSKLDVILQSMSKANKFGPSVSECEA